MLAFRRLRMANNELGNIYLAVEVVCEQGTVCLRHQERVRSKLNPTKLRTCRPQDAMGHTDHYPYHLLANTSSPPRCPSPSPQSRAAAHPAPHGGKLGLAHEVLLEVGVARGEGAPALEAGRFWLQRRDRLLQ